MTEADLNWVAGLMEGEGTFSHIRGGPRDGVFGNTAIALAMTDRDVVQRAAKILGLPEPRFRTGTYTAPHHKDQWVAKTANASEVNRICLLLFSRMGERRQHQIAQVLEINMLRKETFRQKEYSRAA